MMNSVRGSASVWHLPNFPTTTMQPPHCSLTTWFGSVATGVGGGGSKSAAGIGDGGAFGVGAGAFVAAITGLAVAAVLG